MIAEDILVEMGKDIHLTHQILLGISAGMIDEWDCTVSYALENGFSAPEFMIAAKAGASWLTINREIGVDLEYIKVD